MALGILASRILPEKEINLLEKRPSREDRLIAYNDKCSDETFFSLRWRHVANRPLHRFDLVAALDLTAATVRPSQSSGAPFPRQRFSC